MRSHGEKTFYTECEFSETEFTAIEQAKEQAILNKYGNCFLLGTGSRKLSHVYKVITKSGAGTEEMIALKVISAITQECDTSDLETVKNQLKMKLRGSEVENCAESEIKIQYDGINRCPNVIPLDGTDLLDWICPDLGRVGVDYVLKMPLADCLNNRIEDFKKAEDNIDKVIQLGIDICTALEKLHAQEIYHRDIKPANIYYYQGHYCLGDFGIAIHKTNLRLYAIGTEIYCAPEQHYEARKMNPWLCKKYDHRIDIYSLGLVLYELAGKKSVGNLLKQRMNGSLPVLSIGSEGLKKIIQTACQFDPDDRYQNATIFRENLERLQQDKNYIPSQEIGEIFSRTESQMNYQEPDGETCIGKEKDPYEDEFEPEEEKIAVTSVASNMWNVGLFWYEKSCESASRFANLKIDRHIMPLISTEQELSYDFPVKCYTKDATKDQPLSQVIANINNIGDMYLIGEGGSGKTTALYSIMQDTYKGQMYPTKYTNKITIPLFIELSKAPDVYGKAYCEGHSTFIRRYLYLLIKSAQQKKELLTEDKNMLREVFGNNSDDVQDDIVSTIDHLLREDNGIQYLLLLDGLNEVSRKEILFPEGSDTVVELVINEIRELQEYSNVTVVITSRADEAVNFGNDIPKYYLSGIDDATIKQYLEDNEISTDDIMQNARLLNTLRVPFFLKLYCSLMFKDGIMTQGEILYNFFKERSSMYSLRERINTIHSEQRIIDSTHVHKRITEKMQWFILDFILPEIGWYMEKNSLYTIDQQTIKIIVDRILTGTEDTDVCGKYGIAIFEDYHKGTDGSVNTKTYAKYLMELASENQTYIQAIIEYCVYSLGILYVNNQNYGFIHQHIRDFFASMKVITNMKMALDIAENMSNRDMALQCLIELNNDFLDEKIAVFIGEILEEYLNTYILPDILIERKQKHSKPDEKRFLLKRVLSLYKGLFPKEKSVGIAVHNLLMIFEKAHKNLTMLDLANLDLSKCNFNGISLKMTSLDGALVIRQTFFPYGHSSEISCIKVSLCGQYFLTGDSRGIVKLWHLKTRKYIRTILDLQYAINNIQYVNNGEEILISTILGVYLYESKNYNLKAKYKRACCGIAGIESEIILVYKCIQAERVRMEIVYNDSSKRKYFGFGMSTKKNYPKLIVFSPNGKYAVFVEDRWRESLVVYDLVSGSRVVLLWEFRYEREFVSLCFDSTGNYLAIASDKCVKILYFNELLKVLPFTNQSEIHYRLENKENLFETLLFVPDHTAVSTLKFINKNVFLAIGFSNKLFCLYDYKEHISYNIKNFTSTITAIDDLDDGNACVAVIGDEDANIFILNFNTLELVDAEMFPIYNTNSRRIDNIKLLPNGLFIFARQEGQAYYNLNLDKITADLSIKTKKELFSYEIFSNSKKIAAVGIETGIIRIYSLDLAWDDKIIKISENRIIYMEFSPNDKLLLITLENDAPKVVQMNSFEVFTINTFQQRSNKAIFSANGKYIFCCNGNYIEKFSTETFERLYYVKKFREPYHENYVNRTLEHFKENDYQYDPASNVICGPEVMYYQDASEVITVSCSPNFLYIAIAWNDGKVEIRETETLSCIAILEANTFVKSISFTYDGKNMAIPFGKSSVKIYDTHTWHCISILHGAEEITEETLSNEGHTKLVTCICFEEGCGLANEIKVITASNDGTIKYWKPFSSNTIEPFLKKHKYLLMCKKLFTILWKKFYFTSGTIIGEDGTTIGCNDIRYCEKTIYYTPGLDIDGSTIRNLHPDSDLSEKDLYILKLNGAVIE